MWKLIKISQQTYFIYCNFNTNKQEVTFVLYDLKETWSQTLTLRDIKQKVKLLNKRLDFSDDNIKEALTGDVIQFAELEEEPHGSTINVDSCLLKLKYRVMNCLLTYEWALRKQTLIEFQKTFVQPLLMALLGCHQQVEILTESLRKKDLELKQYRIEGAVLNRKTLSTKPFDFDNFNKTYEDCNTIAINFKELANYVKEADMNKVPNMMLNEPLNNKIESDVKLEEKPNHDQTAKTSPKQRKRKAKEQKLQQLKQHLKLRKQGLEYESSQSQTPSSGNSQTIEETEFRDIREQKQNTESKTDKTSSHRKSARCTPINQKREYISSEDKTESQNDERFKTLTDRKTTRNLANLTKDTGTNSTKNQNKEKSQNNAKETSRKCVNALNQSKLLEKLSGSSNIVDISSDTEDDMPLKDRITLLKTQNTLPSFRETRNRLCIESPVVENKSVESVVSQSSNSPRIKNLSHSPTPVIIDDISSQLNNIKKELESLEAMRLADLKQRMCKA